jgi:hypothetical protein
VISYGYGPRALQLWLLDEAIPLTALLETGGEVPRPLGGSTARRCAATRWC